VFFVSFVVNPFIGLDVLYSIAKPRCESLCRCKPALGDERAEWLWLFRDD
jgi:hypothetical protein